MNKPFLVDTNILVYSVNGSSIYHEKAKLFLENYFPKREITLSIQNLVEFFATVTNKKHFPVPMPVTKAIENLELFSVSSKTILDNLKTGFTLISLLKKHPVLAQDIHDLHLAAVMIDNNIDTIYTADPKIFSRLGLKAINPLK